MLVKPGRLLLLAATLGLGRIAGSQELSLQPGSRIWVTGTSNVKNFECNALNPDLSVSTSTPNAVSALLAGKKAVGAVDLKVTVVTMDCGDGTTNERMMATLKAADHPSIRFVLASYSPAKTADGVALTLHGALTIGGVSKQVTIPAVANVDASGVLRVTGEYDVQMAQYDLRPPSLLMGTVTIGDKVQVHFDLALKN